ncbi:hypothetical protein A6U87_06005 [Rhizobium sp. AC44/96]|uniref:hypothetical protein n=1 Tax=unclassified Rhizobium TaxID=2613769 RepID=UPI00080FC6E8|nr:MULTISPECIES: hypothetical protein [unclassified Rhizobium]MDM9623278.1 hypothetical protein [Rhizobium sp. S96]OCJ12864.1 hypothetical protein A6U87_06005 [Rhizobium sp. AC44/96]
MATHNEDTSSKSQVTETATEARQGSYGKPVFIVLICGLLLALITWGGLEIWGESADKDPTPTASTSTGSTPLEPSGAGTFDDNAADGTSRPPEATDKSPAPSGNGNGSTQVTTPTGNEKTR